VPTTPKWRIRILTAQGECAQGGRRSYIDGEGRLTGGFVILMWPADYGSPAQHTFAIDAEEREYAVDLGPDTDAIARGMTEFNPVPGWKQLR
jgi:hypothetical protein